MREPAVEGMPSVTSTSLMAIGTPASAPSGSPAARRRSMPAAVSSARSPSTWRNACTAPSTAAMRSRCARVASTEDTSPAARRSPSSAADRRMRSLTAPPPGSPTPRTASRRTRARPRAPARAVSTLSPTTSSRKTLRMRDRVARRRHVGRGHLAHLLDRLHDLAELRREVLDLFLGERDAGEVREVGDLLRTDFGHAAPSCRGGDAPILSVVPRPALDGAHRGLPNSPTP